MIVMREIGTQSNAVPFRKPKGWRRRLKRPVTDGTVYLFPLLSEKIFGVRPVCPLISGFRHERTTAGESIMDFAKSNARGFSGRVCPRIFAGFNCHPDSRREPT